MKICLTTPNRNAPNGGIRLINDFHEQLNAMGHDCYLMDEASPSSPGKILKRIDFNKHRWELVICCSPHSAWTLERKNVKRSIVWAQMAEHLFRPNNRQFVNDCDKWYNHSTVICNSAWLKNFMPKAAVCRTWLPSYFEPIQFEGKEKQIDNQFDILLESPFSMNPTKDVHRLARQAAKYLQQKYNARVAIYGSRQNLESEQNMFILPSLHKLKWLYQSSSLLLKATLMDGFACAPIEAARFGCVTVRAIDNGDDWLNDEWAYRTTYEKDRYFHSCEYAFLSSQNYNKQTTTFTEPTYGETANAVDFMLKQKKAKHFAQQWNFSSFITEFGELTNIKF